MNCTEMSHIFWLKLHLLCVVRFQVFTAATMNITALWDIAPHSLIEVNRRFIGAYCVGPSLIDIMMEAV
jgi:hypothetical protein